MIEKGVPIPKPRKSKWSFINDMEVGDSIHVDNEPDYQRARDAMRHYCRINEWNYITRKEPDGSGYRVWRTA
jgi:hypothetical protein